MNNGWIKLHRKILDNPISQKPHYAWLWVYLLLIANHETQEFIWNNERKTVKRGQLLTGRLSLAEATGIPPTTVERILEYLEKDGQIGQQKTNKYRLITLKNYNEYQHSGQQTDIKRTTNGQQTDTNKNVKNDKNVKNYKDGQTFSFKDGTVGIRRFGEWVDINTHAKLGHIYLSELNN